MFKEEDIHTDGYIQMESATQHANSEIDHTLTQNEPSHIHWLKIQQNGRGAKPLIKD